MDVAKGEGKKAHPSLCIHVSLLFTEPTLFCIALLLSLSSLCSLSHSTACPSLSFQISHLILPHHSWSFSSFLKDASERDARYGKLYILSPCHIALYETDRDELPLLCVFTRFSLFISRFLLLYHSPLTWETYPETMCSFAVFHFLGLIYPHSVQHSSFSLALSLLALPL